MKRKLPATVLARWRAEDWDDETMTASRYTYFIQDEDGYTGEQTDLTEAEAAQYSWGRCEDNLTGGSQCGELREVAK